MSPTGAHLTLYEERCDRCGRCRDVCPRGALKVGSAFIYVDWRVCDGCMKCVEACDRGAVVRRVVPTRSNDVRTDVDLTDVTKVVVGSRAEAKAVRKAAEKAAKEKKQARRGRVLLPSREPAPAEPQPVVPLLTPREDPIATAAEEFASYAANATAIAAQPDATAPFSVVATAVPVSPPPLTVVPAPAAVPTAAPAPPRGRTAERATTTGTAPSRRAKERTPRTSYPTSGSLVAWGWSDVLAVLGIMLVSLAVKNAVLALPQVALMPPLGRTAVRIGVLTFYYIVQIAGFGWVAGRHGVPALQALGLSRGDDEIPGPSALGSAGLVIALFIGCEVATVAYGFAMQALHVTQPAFVASDMTAVFGSGVVGVTLAALLVALAAPLAEEIAFRGVVLPAIGDRFGMWPGILGSAVIYALFHASVWMFVPMMVLGVALGWLVWTRRSLWPAIALHVLYNGMAVAAAFISAK